MDLFPSPAMRDNLITLSMMGIVDEDELCADLVGDAFDDEECRGNAKSSTLGNEGETGSGRSGLIAWNNPWDVSGWEITEGFVKKWGFLLKGCPELLEHTNRWRAVRDEEPLVVNINDVRVRY
jgi:hypothetical protein